MNTKPHFRRMADGSTVQVRRSVVDGMSNMITAIGENNAKVSASYYSMSMFSNNPALLDTAYLGSTWYSKIVNIPAEDATREWRRFLGKQEDIKKLEKLEKKLKLQSKVKEAMAIARHRGGAAIIIGGLRGRYSSEVNIENVREGDLKFLTVVSKDELTVKGEIDWNPLSPYYGFPKYFSLSSSNGPVDIHRSRLVIFNGRRAPGSDRTSSTFWGTSIFEQLADSITAADSGAGIMSALLHEGVVDVVKVPDFIKSFAIPGGEDIHTARWAMAKRMKSNGNVLMLDAADEWEQKQITWAGLPEVIQCLLTIMAGAADIPVTRLIGRSASGMNATGEGDLRNYYDQIKSKQTMELEPAIDALDQILFRSALGREADETWYEWKPLWQPSEQELAEIDRIERQTENALAARRLVPEKALQKMTQNRLIESGRWPGAEEALKEFPDFDPLPAVAPPAPGGRTGAAPTGLPGPAAIARTPFGDAAPRTLYVRRDVLNRKDFTDWAKANGITDLVPDLHVTITYSREHVDWMKMGRSWNDRIDIPAGGPRVLSNFGPTEQAHVLEFIEPELNWRNEEMRDKGASYDFPEYKPHITLQIGGEWPDSIKPYTGKIVLGPEIFEELRDG